MMKGYPIGYLMVWECPELDKKKTIGVGDHNYPEPKDKGKTLEEILAMEEENALPHDWENMTYKCFLEKRRKLMAAKIKAGFNKLDKD